MDQTSRISRPAAGYPLNLTDTQLQQHILLGFHQCLEQHANRLFGDDGPVSYLDLRTANSLVYDAGELKGLNDVNVWLHRPQQSGVSEPLSRIVFIRAANSRQKLKISRQMFESIFSYHQVWPEFISEFCTFGAQGGRDPYRCSSFRCELSCPVAISSPNASPTGPVSPLLRQCCTLLGVERLPTSEGSDRQSWSIRPAAFYHSIELESGRSFWVIVKANQILRKRIEGVAETKASYHDRPSVANKSFAASLEILKILAGWASEQWRWYIDELENHFQEDTRSVLLSQIHREPSPVRNVTGSLFNAFAVRQNPADYVESNQGWINRFLSAFPSISRYLSAQDPPPGPIPLRPSCQKSRQPRLFIFDALQDAQVVDEKATRASLAMASNIETLEAIVSQYAALIPSHDISRSFADIAGKDFSAFQSCMQRVLDELKTSHTRLCTIKGLLKARMELLDRIFNYQNMQATHHLAGQAQRSQINVEIMTNFMQYAANVTEREAISMKIITLITLVFLPGTFVCTLMSTDVVKWVPSDTTKSQERVFSWQALVLFLCLSAFLMITIYVIWARVYRDVKRRSQDKLAETMKQITEAEEGRALEASRRHF